MLEENAERATWSDELRTLFGLPDGVPVPSLNDWLTGYVHPADRDDLRRRFASWVAGGYESTARAFRALARTAAAPRSGPPRGDRNHPLLLFGVVIDLPERKPKACARRRRAAWHPRVGMGTWDLTCVMARHWDAQMWLLRGLRPQPRAMTREERLACVHPDDRSRVAAIYALPMNEGGPREHEFRIVRPDGQIRWLASRSLELTDELSGTRKRIGVNWDVTDTRNADSAHREREIAQRESQAKSKFLARMSHELRTPLNAVLGFSQLLLAEDQGSDAAAASRRRRLDHIRSAGQHLLQLINDVLDLSSLEGGELRIAAHRRAGAAVLRRWRCWAVIDASATGHPRRIVGMPRRSPRQRATGAWNAGMRARGCAGAANVSNAVKSTRRWPGDIEALQRGENVLLRVTDTGRGSRKTARTC